MSLVKKAKRLIQKKWDEREIIDVLKLADALEIDVLDNGESFNGILLEAKREITAELKAGRKAALEKFRDYASYGDRTKLFNVVRDYLQTELGHDRDEATNIAAAARADIDTTLAGQALKKVAAFPENWPVCETCHDIKTPDYFLDLETLEVTPTCSDCVSARDKKRKACAKVS